MIEWRPWWFCWLLTLPPSWLLAALLSAALATGAVTAVAIRLLVGWYMMAAQQALYAEFRSRGLLDGPL